jgi:hypothetical protein
MSIAEAVRSSSLRARDNVQREPTTPPLGAMMETHKNMIDTALRLGKLGVLC